MDSKKEKYLRLRGIGIIFADHGDGEISYEPGPTVTLSINKNFDEMAATLERAVAQIEADRDKIHAEPIHSHVEAAQPVSALARAEAKIARLPEHDSAPSLYSDEHEVRKEAMSKNASLRDKIYGEFPIFIEADLSEDYDPAVEKLRLQYLAEVLVHDYASARAQKHLQGKRFLIHSSQQSAITEVIEKDGEEWIRVGSEKYEALSKNIKKALKEIDELKKNEKRHDYAPAKKLSTLGRFWNVYVKITAITGVVGALVGAIVEFYPTQPAPQQKSAPAEPEEAPSNAANYKCDVRSFPREQTHYVSQCRDSDGKKLDMQRQETSKGVAKVVMNDGTRCELYFDAEEEKPQLNLPCN